MAYCRWSDNDFDCDLYVYESVYGGFQVMIAGMRTVFDRSLLPDLPPSPDKSDQEDKDWKDWVQKLWKWHKIRKDLFDNATHEPIGGPYDGQSRAFETAQEVIEFLENELAPTGKYRWPDYLIPDLEKWSPDED